jgi:hypothetical protein
MHMSYSPLEKPPSLNGSPARRLTSPLQECCGSDSGLVFAVVRLGYPPWQEQEQVWSEGNSLSVLHV